jgi:hypothetical protein
VKFSKLLRRQNPLVNISAFCRFVSILEREIAGPVINVTVEEMVLDCNVFGGRGHLDGGGVGSVIILKDRGVDPVLLEELQVSIAASVNCVSQ